MYVFLKQLGLPRGILFTHRVCGDAKLLSRAGCGVRPASLHMSLLPKEEDHNLLYGHAPLVAPHLAGSYKSPTPGCFPAQSGLLTDVLSAQCPCRGGKEASTMDDSLEK